MSTPCEKHASIPAVGNSPCAGCEIERLMAEVDSITREADRQYTTIEAYRKDAERYQWLREKQTFIWLIQDWFPSDTEFTDVDAEIDAAMSKDPLADKGQ